MKRPVGAQHSRIGIPPRAWRPVLALPPTHTHSHLRSEGDFQAERNM